MRTILIEPLDRMISEASLPDSTGGIRRRFGEAELIRIGTLPSGDGVYVVPFENNGTFFSIGGSGPHYGVGLIFGKRGAFGVLQNAITDFDALASIVTFGPPPSGEYALERNGTDGDDGEADTTDRYGDTEK